VLETKIGFAGPSEMDGKKEGVMISTTEIITLGRRLGLKNSEGYQYSQSDRFE